MNRNGIPRRLARRGIVPRLVAGAALATVAVVAGVVSYTHIDALTLALHGSVMVGHLMPLAVDGLIVVGSVFLLTTAGRQARWGWLGIVPGAAASLFANFESGIPHGRLAAGWATVPALFFALATLLFERWLKAQVTGAAGTAGPGKGATGGESGGTQPDPCSHHVASSAEESAVQAFLHARDCLGRPLSQRQLSAAFGVSRPRVAELVGPHLPEAPVPAMNGSPPHE